MTSISAVLLALLVWLVWPASPETQSLTQKAPPSEGNVQPASQKIGEEAALGQRESKGTVTLAAAEEASEPAQALSAEPIIPPPAEPIARTGEASPSPAPEPPGRAPLLADLIDDQATTWPQLGRLWGVQMELGDDTCEKVLNQGLQCFRSNGLDFEQVRSFDRPAMLLLHQDGVVKWVRLLAIDATHARLASTGRVWTLPLSDLQPLWKSGALATLWKLPPGQTKRVFNAGPNDPAGEWLHKQLKTLQASGQLKSKDDSYLSLITAFQEANGLRYDGRASPTTFVLANRVLGIDEPNLRGPVR